MSRRITLSRSRGRIEAPLEHDWEVFQRGEDRRQQQRERTATGSVMTRGQIGGAESNWVGLAQLDKTKLKAFAQKIDSSVKKATGQGKTAIKALEQHFGGTENEVLQAYLDEQREAGVNPYNRKSESYADFFGDSDSDLEDEPDPAPVYEPTTPGQGLLGSMSNWFAGAPPETVASLERGAGAV